jgi:5'-deoxynucleotidase YfbR-like HD superfamily hydrolase
MKDTQDVLATYATIGLLAGVLRHNSVTFDASRHENVAEHSYSLAVLAAAIASDLNKNDGEEIDIGKVVQFATVHDLVEAYMDEGDISVYASSELRKNKEGSEKLALENIKKRTAHSWIPDTIEKYESQDTVEAHFVYALDKLVVHMNVILSNKHHADPTFSNYAQTERRARQKISRSYDKLLVYFDELCKMFRAKPYLFKDGQAK